MAADASGGFFAFYALLNAHWQGPMLLALVLMTVFGWYQFRSPALGLPALTNNRDLVAALDPCQLAPPLRSAVCTLLYCLALGLGYVLLLTAVGVLLAALAAAGLPLLAPSGSAPSLWSSLPVWLLPLIMIALAQWPTLRAADARLRYALQRRACVPPLMPGSALQIVADLCHEEAAFHPSERDIQSFLAAGEEALVSRGALTANRHTIAHKWSKLCFLRDRLLRWCEVRDSADFCDNFGAQLRDIKRDWRQIREELIRFCELGLIADPNADFRDSDAPNDDISGYIHQRLDDTLLECYCFISHGIFSGYHTQAQRRRAFAFFGLLVNVHNSPLDALTTAPARVGALLDNPGDDMPDSERRNSRRRIEYATAELVVADKHYVCSPIELSVSGAALHLDAPVATGTPAELDIIGLPPIPGSIVRSADEKICIEFAHNTDSRRQLRHYLAAAAH